jgi:hypothetical protein
MPRQSPQVDLYQGNGPVVTTASFIVCNACFWCASDLSEGSRITKCLSCGGVGKLESIPLAPKEKYSFNIDQKQGIVLDFGKTL